MPQALAAQDRGCAVVLAELEQPDLIGPLGREGRRLLASGTSPVLAALAVGAGRPCGCGSPTSALRAHLQRLCKHKHVVAEKERFPSGVQLQTRVPRG